MTADPASGDPFARGAPFGRFLLVEAIGAGALFEAHRAKSFGVLGFEKDVAVKLVRPELERDASARTRLVDAARRSTSLCHANILSVLELGVATLGEHERTFLVTELARGVALASALERLRAASSRVPPGAVLALCADVAKALDHAHRRRGAGGPVIHGALGPRQIFVTPEGDVKVGDFAIGAPGDATPATDLAALGALLRELAEVVEVEKDAIVRVADALEAGEVPDAGTAHELLIEHAYRLGPDAHQRDPARFVGTGTGALPPSIGVHELLREPSSAVPGRELPLVLVGLGDRSETAESTLREDAVRTGGVVLLDSPSLVVAFGLVDPDGRDTDLAFVYAQAAASRLPEATLLVTTGVLERATDGSMRLVLASRSDLLEIASARARGATTPRVAASSRASLAARGAFTFEVDADQPELSWLIAARGPTRAATRFVGRADELRQLAEAVQGASRGQARLLRVVGPVGSGKTRLVLELERRAGGRLTLALARCPRHGQPFDALGVAIRELLGAASPDEVEARLAALALGAADAHVLGALGGGNVSASRAAFAAVHAAFAELLRRVARGRPHVCAFDDAEHVDAASLAVVRDVAADPDSRVLFLLLERREPVADGEDPLPVLFVPPLDDDALAALVATRLGARLIPPEVLDLFATRTGGVPLAALELVRELVERALIEVKNGTVVVDKRANDVVPQGAAELLRARVAVLPAEPRLLLATLDALGRASSGDELARAAGLGVDACERALEVLGLAGLVVEHVDGALPVGASAEFAAAGLAAVERSALARRAADAIAARGERLAAAASRLRSGDAPGAARDTLAAVRDGGEDLAKASLLLGLRIGDLEAPDDVVEALCLLAVATQSGAAGLDVSDVLPRALSRVDDALDPRERARARRAAAVVASSALDAELAHVLLDQADALDATSDEARARRLQIACRLLDPELAAGMLVEPARDERLGLDVLLDLAEVATLADALDTARSALRDARARSPEGAALARTTRLEATLYARTSTPDAAGGALAELSASVRLARDADAPREVGRALLALARTALAAGELARARAAFDEVAEVAHVSGDELVGELARAAVAALAAPTVAEQTAHFEERQKTARAAGRSALARAIADLAAQLHGSRP